MSGGRQRKNESRIRIVGWVTTGAVGFLVVSALGGAWVAEAQTAPESVERVAEPANDALTKPLSAETSERVQANGPLDEPPFDVDAFSGGGGSASELVHVPVSKLFPGDVKVGPSVRNPMDDPGAAERGMRYYNQFNCVGCHAPNGSGGMGRSLSNSMFVYGSEPENIYLSILQGRPNGMPVFGGLLPDQVIWDLVAYIMSISKEPSGEWGKTTSADGFTIEQVPAEFLQTTEPWRHTNPFSYGQAPFEKPKGSPPLETPGDGEPLE